MSSSRTQSFVKCWPLKMLVGFGKEIVGGIGADIGASQINPNQPNLVTRTNFIQYCVLDALRAARAGFRDHFYAAFSIITCHVVLENRQRGSRRYGWCLWNQILSIIFSVCYLLWSKIIRFTGPRNHVTFICRSFGFFGVELLCAGNCL